MDKQILEVYVGAQGGDEGKAKIVDEAAAYAQQHSHDGRKHRRTMVVRFQGGDNAGHSVYVRASHSDDKTSELVKFVSHAVPIGVASNSDIGFGPSVALNPLSAVHELQEAREKFAYSGMVLISERAGVLLDYHKRLDAWRENSREQKIGTTKSGIGPFYEDNARRDTRISFADYVSENFPDRLRDVLRAKQLELEAAGIFSDCYGKGSNMTFSQYLEWLLAEHQEARKELYFSACALEYVLNDYLRSGHHLIVEGAQGTVLDVDMGTYPQVTSSHLLAPHAFASLGLPRKAFQVYGIEKIYPTRVGAGALPTLAAEGDPFAAVADDAGEFGATTGRRRRVGYPDWVMIKRAVMLNDLDGIFLTRTDCVQDKELKVCTAYRYRGRETSEVPLDLSKVEPVYLPETFSWHLWGGPKNLADPSQVDAQLRPLREAYVQGGFSSLPGELQRYILLHDNFVRCETVGVSIGPTRGETVR